MEEKATQEAIEAEERAEQDRQRERERSQ